MNKKLTQEDVVAQFEAIEKIKKRGYTFQNVKYVDTKTKVSITCPIHGDFSVIPAAFKRGNGCGKCSIGNTLTQEKIISQFEEIEKVKQRGYTFKNVVYVDLNTKVAITCKDHGDFFVTPKWFKKGAYCKQCFSLKDSQEKVISQFEEIEKIKQRGYTFKNVVYVEANAKVLITCPTHGDFLMAPSKFKMGQGCSKCACNKQLTQEEVLIQFEEIEKTKKRGYIFTNVKYINDSTKVSITCPIHGDFQMQPSSFKQGSGCPNCALNKKLTQEEVLVQFEEIEKIKQRGYTFTKFIYVNDFSKVLITCPIHGDFEIVPSSYKQGNGCPCCSKRGFQKEKPGIFYYVRLNKDGCEVYKPGITNRTIKERYPKDFKFMTVIKTIEFETGKEAYDFEQSVLNDYAYAKWTGRPLLPNNGNTELMKYDILGWDN